MKESRKRRAQEGGRGGDESGGNGSGARIDCTLLPDSNGGPAPAAHHVSRPPVGIDPSFPARWAERVVLLLSSWAWCEGEG